MYDPVDKILEMGYEAIDRRADYNKHLAEYRREKLLLRDKPPYCDMKSKTAKDDQILIDTHQTKLNLIEEERELNKLELELYILKEQFNKE